MTDSQQSKSVVRWPSPKSLARARAGALAEAYGDPFCPACDMNVNACTCELAYTPQPAVDYKPEDFG